MVNDRDRSPQPLMTDDQAREAVLRDAEKEYSRVAAGFFLDPQESAEILAGGSVRGRPLTPEEKVELSAAYNVVEGIKMVRSWNMSYAQEPDGNGNYSVRGRNFDGREIVLSCSLKSDRLPGLSDVILTYRYSGSCGQEGWDRDDVRALLYKVRPALDAVAQKKKAMGLRTVVEHTQ